MKVSFTGQGIISSSNISVGSCLIQSLVDSSFNSFVGISAFASQAGVIGINKSIKLAKSQGKSITIIVGVDQKGTSKEALEALLELGVNSSGYSERKKI